MADFYWNFNPGGKYDASADPAYWSARAKWQEDERNKQLKDRADEAEGRLTAGRAQINTDFDNAFTPDFYKGYADDLMAHWRPDIDRQYKDAQDDLNFTFARTQPGGGTASADAFGRLKEGYDKSLLQATDNATSQSDQLRASNEGQRNALLNQLASGADPSIVVQQAQGTIGSVPRVPTYSPIGDLFSNITSQFATAQDAYASDFPGWGFGVRPRGGASGRRSPETIVN